MNVWVIMGNDYPEAVFSKEEDAKAYCKRQTEANELNRKRGESRKIYYRAYDFTLDKREGK